MMEKINKIQVRDVAKEIRIALNLKTCFLDHHNVIDSCDDREVFPDHEWYDLSGASYDTIPDAMWLEAERIDELAKINGKMGAQ